MSWDSDNRWWLDAARKRWSPVSPEPLVLRAWLDAPVACDGYDPLTIEGALQHAVCMRETGRLPDDVYEGCPLNASLESTDIAIPIVDTVVDGLSIANVSIGWFAVDAISTRRQGWKRARADNYGRDLVRLSSAENKTQEVSRATMTASYTEFFANADRSKIEDLLRDIDALGASRSGGLGGVHGWEVLSCSVKAWFVGPGGRLMRALPLTDATNRATWADVREATLRAPYWHPRTRRTCMVPIQRIGEPLVCRR